jgi:hypothetical protein
VSYTDVTTVRHRIVVPSTEMIRLPVAPLTVPRTGVWWPQAWVKIPAADAERDGNFGNRMLLIAANAAGRDNLAAIAGNLDFVELLAARTPVMRKRMHCGHPVMLAERDVITVHYWCDAVDGDLIDEVVLALEEVS